MYLLGKLQMTDKTVLYFFGKFVSLNHRFYAFRLGYVLQGTLLEISIFPCSGRQSFTMILHEQDLEICYCLPTQLLTAFLLLKPSGQGLPLYQCNNQREGLYLLCGQLWLVSGVSCWLVCLRKLRVWQMGCTACFLVYLRAFFACVYVCVCHALPISSFA